MAICGLTINHVTRKRPAATESPVRYGVIPEFVVDKVTMGQVLERILLFSPVSITLPLLYTHSTKQCRELARF